MIEIRFHGRGGQGVVTAAEILARGAVIEGKFAHAFPSFGPERRGAPIASFVRISDSKIRTREQIYDPDYVVVIDSTLHTSTYIIEGVKSNGCLIINSPKSVGEITAKLKTDARILTIDADKIVMRILKKPISNTAMLGALVSISEVISLKSLKKAIEQIFPKDMASKNMKVAVETYKNTYHRRG